MEEKELTCDCGNSTFSEGFYPCDEDGNETEPFIESDWDGTYICAKCGKIHKM